MTLFAPAALLFALLGIPILLLYMLRLRRRPVTVSSTFLWEALLRQRQANTPWQRLRRNLLLFVQLLILAALVLAAARPALPFAGVSAGSVLMVLDGSASMNATDIPPDRFDAAQAAARSIVAGLPPGVPATLILAANPPRTLLAASTDRAALRQALDAARPGQGAADWLTTFALVNGAAQAAQPGATILIFSDGGLPSSDLATDNGLALPGSTRYLAVGKSANNLAVAALAARPSSQGIVIYCRVVNYDAEPHEALLSFYRDEALFDSRLVKIPPGESQSVSLTHPTGGAARITARLSPSQGGAALDALPLDDVAYTVVSERRQVNALLSPYQLSPRIAYNQFLQQGLISLLGEGRAYLARPGLTGLELPTQSFDLFVFDRLLPGQLPHANLLLFNVSANSLFNVGQVFSDTAPVTLSDSPLLAGVDWSQVHIRQAQQVELPAWAQVLVSSPGGPLVFSGEVDGRRVAVFTFSLHDSDLPLQVAFPIMLANLVDYLAGAPLAIDLPEDGFQAGQALALPPDLRGVELVLPDQQVISLENNQEGNLAFTLDETGFYTLRVHDQPTQTVSFAVNLFAPQESDIRPRAALQLGAESVPAAPLEKSGWSEIWLALVALGLGLLCLEWWLFYRKPSEQKPIPDAPYPPDALYPQRPGKGRAT